MTVTAAAPTLTVAVRIEGLRRTHPGRRGEPDVLANDDISFEVARGEVFGLLGPNGAGKTTLVRQLVGVLAPDRGSVTLLGHQVRHAARLVAWLAQEEPALVELPVGLAVETTGRLRGLPRREARAATAALLEELGLTELASRPMTTLSGGQRRLAQVATALVADRPLAVWKDYLALRILDAEAGVLSKSFVDENFAFYGTVLSDQPENEVRWKRGVEAVNGAMGEAVGKLYVAKYFLPEAKAKIDALVHNLLTSMGASITAANWMSPATKAQALAKLATFDPKLGYPSKWRDYSRLAVVAGDAIGNSDRANAFEYDRNLAKLGGPLDRTEWGMTPMTINAYYNPPKNEIVFPAAILQPPFFDPNADPAVNYGGIGAVIGHEMSHHFDDQGAKYDLTGKLVKWWTPADTAAFQSRLDALGKQYDAYEPLPGMHVQGKLTMGENTADLAGLTVAHDAYLASLGGSTPPVIDGMTGDQRFYLGWAQVWRRNYREANLRQRLLTDPHSPSEQRGNIVRNMDPWYSAFGAQPGQKLYLAPAQRVRIW